MRCTFRTKVQTESGTKHKATVINKNLLGGIFMEKVIATIVIIVNQLCHYRTDGRISGYC